jgi:predicted DsbA family dithiol-disulfide isomerase
VGQDPEGADRSADVIEEFFNRENATAGMSMNMKPMTVEIWSDVVCPWCYIGKRRFERALERFAHRDDVRVIWRSFQLDPGAPSDGTESVNDLLARKYNVSPAQARAMTEQVTATAAEEGLEYHLENARRGNTLDAHRLIHLATERGLQDVAKERLLRAYFTEGLPIGDRETLVRLAAEIGIPAEEARAMLAGDRYADAVRADIDRGASFGISGVPFFAIDERYGVSGAQSPEVLLAALERAWAEKNPLEQIAAPGSADGCDNGSCAVPGEGEGAGVKGQG